MTLTCAEFRELMGDHAGGELLVEVRDVFEVHRTGCPDCGFYLESYTHTVKVTRLLPRCGPLPPAVEARLRAAIGMQLGGAAADGSGTPP